MNELERFIVENKRYDLSGIGRLGFIRVDDVLSFLKHKAILSRGCTEATKMVMEIIDKQATDFDFSKFIEEIDTELKRIG